MADTARSVAAGPIVLGTEFGPVSRAAERSAIAVAAADGVELLIVHAIDTHRLRLPGGLWRARVDQVQAGRERDAAAVVEQARAAGVMARVLIWSGDPASCLVDVARAEGASRIVVGTHGRGRVGRALAGSVSADVLDAADCPVDIVSAETP